MIAGESADFKVDPRPMTPPHSSWTKFYRLVQPLNRPIGQAVDEHGQLDGRELLATTAKKHYDGESGYPPPELTNYLANPADAHLEPVPEKASPRAGGVSPLRVPQP